MIHLVYPKLIMCILLTGSDNTVRGRCGIFHVNTCLILVITNVYPNHRPINISIECRLQTRNIGMRLPERIYDCTK